MRRNIFYVILLSSFLLRCYPPTANFSTWVLACGAIFGPAEIILTLFISWIFLSLNTSLFQDLSEIGVIGRYVNVGVAFLYFVNKQAGFIWPRVPKTILIFVLFLILHSILISINPVVSALKSVLWTMVTGLILASWLSMSDAERDRVLFKIYYFLSLIALFSLATYFIEEGRSVNGAGFQGLLNHPQVFGATMALLCSICIIIFLKDVKVHGPIIIASLSFILMCESRSRTAIFAFLISVVICTPIILIRNRPYESRYFVLLIKKIIAFILLATTMWFFISISTNIYQYIQGLSRQNLVVDTSSQSVNSLTAPNQSVNSLTVPNLIFKNSSTNNFLEIYSISRGSLISTAMSDIKANTLFGIGFGVGDVDQSRIKYDPFLGVVMSYPVEKGVFMLAIIQELGIFGLLILMSCIAPFAKNMLWKFESSIILFGTILLLNLGEYTIMSVGGIGMLQIILITYVFSKSKRYE